MRRAALAQHVTSRRQLEQYFLVTCKHVLEHIFSPFMCSVFTCPACAVAGRVVSDSFLPLARAPIGPADAIEQASCGCSLSGSASRPNESILGDEQSTKRASIYFIPAMLLLGAHQPMSLPSIKLVVPEGTMTYLDYVGGKNCSPACCVWRVDTRFESVPLEQGRGDSANLLTFATRLSISSKGACAFE